MSFTGNPAGDAALDGHYYIDLDYFEDGGDFTNYIVTMPESLTFGDQINGEGNCAWQYSFSAEDIEGNPIIVHNGQANPSLQPYLTGPWWSWYRLRCGSTVIQAGVISNFNVKHGDQFISLAGRTWEAYLTRWEYPFDPRDGHLYDWAYDRAFQGNEATPSGALKQNTGEVYSCYNRDLTLILTDLLQKAMVEVLYRMQFNLSNIVESGVRINDSWAPGDVVKIYDKVNELANTGNGFDWWISHNKQFYTGTPHRYGNMNSPDIAYYFVAGEDPVLNLEWNNDGIVGNHVTGKGVGLATGTTLAAAYGYEMMQQRYTRLDTNYQFEGNIKNLERLRAMTRRQLALDMDALITIPISVDPSTIDNFWSIFRKGKAVHIYWDMYFHTVNSPSQIKSYTCRVTNEGNAVVDFTHERIYDYNTDIGNPAL